MISKAKKESEPQEVGRQFGWSTFSVFLMIMPMVQVGPVFMTVIIWFVLVPV
jgi:hypothetical protein